MSLFRNTAQSMRFLNIEKIGLLLEFSSMEKRDLCIHHYLSHEFDTLCA